VLPGQSYLTPQGEVIVEKGTRVKLWLCMENNKLGNKAAQVPLHPQWILHKLPKINLAAPW
jgi:hypothetical protein